jgi:hypothetical protein
MFCKNLRTKIALADSKPAPTVDVINTNNNDINFALPAVSPIQTSSVKNADAATDLYLRNQPMDPAMQYLLKQQLDLCQQPPSTTTMAQNNGHHHGGHHHHHQVHQVNPQQLFQQQQQPYHHNYHHDDHHNHRNHHQQQQQQQERPPILAYGDGTYQVPPSYAGHGDDNNNNNNIYNVGGVDYNDNNHNINNDNNNNNMNLWQQIQAQKEHEARIMQFRQLMALNIHQKQNRGKSPAKNFRASAA